jgi:AhpD family alkylhydroperoxidase
MESRIDYAKVAPGVRTAMWALEEYVHQTGLEPALLEWVKLRASLINGCAYCADMHTKVARSLGETEQRLYAVSLWSETPFFSERERAALAWTEAVTRVRPVKPRTVATSRPGSKSQGGDSHEIRLSRRHL